jgi:hypothetical protein
VTIFLHCNCNVTRLWWKLLACVRHTLDWSVRFATTFSFSVSGKADKHAEVMQDENYVWKKWYNSNLFRDWNKSDLNSAQIIPSVNRYVTTQPSKDCCLLGTLCDYYTVRSLTKLNGTVTSKFLAGTVKKVCSPFCFMERPLTCYWKNL